MTYPAFGLALAPDTPSFTWGEVSVASDPTEAALLWGALLSDFEAQREAIKLAENVLQPLRDRVGRIKVTSWYRTPSHNAIVGGAPASLHMRGSAVDIVALNMSQAEMRSVLEASFGAVLSELLYYPDHTHLALRQRVQVGSVIGKGSGPETSGPDLLGPGVQIAVDIVITLALATLVSRLLR